MQWYLLFALSIPLLASGLALLVTAEAVVGCLVALAISAGGGLLNYYALRKVIQTSHRAAAFEDTRPEAR